MLSDEDQKGMKLDEESSKRLQEEVDKQSVEARSCFAEISKPLHFELASTL